METIKIATQSHGKKVPVDGFRVGTGLAVTRAIPRPPEGPSWWNVTHIPSGETIAGLYSTKEEAERIAMTLLKVADDCGFAWDDIKTEEQFWDLPADTIRAIKAIVGPVGIEIGMGARR